MIEMHNYDKLEGDYLVTYSPHVPPYELHALPDGVSAQQIYPKEHESEFWDLDEPVYNRPEDERPKIIDISEIDDVLQSYPDLNKTQSSLTVSTNPNMMYDDWSAMHSFKPTEEDDSDLSEEEPIILSEEQPQLCADPKLSVDEIVNYGSAFAIFKQKSLLNVYRPSQINDNQWNEIVTEAKQIDLMQLATEDQDTWNCYPTNFTIGYWKKFFSDGKKYSLKLPNGSTVIIDTIYEFEDLVYDHCIENPILIRTDTLDGGGRRKGRKRKGKRRPRKGKGRGHMDCSPGNVYEISALLVTSATGSIDTVIALNNPQQILAGVTAVGAQDLADNWDAYSVKRVSMSTQMTSPLTARQGQWTLIVDHDSPPPTTTITQSLMLTYTKKRTYSAQGAPRWSVTPRKLSQAIYYSAPAADPEPATIVQKGKYDWATPPSNGFMYVKLTGGPASTTIGTIYIRVHVTAWYKRRQSLTAIPESMPIPMLPPSPQEKEPNEEDNPKIKIVEEVLDSSEEEDKRIQKVRRAQLSTRRRI